MSRRARARKNSRPWELQRDSGDDSNIELLLDAADSDPDEHMREQAWRQHEAEQGRAQRAPS